VRILSRIGDELVDPELELRTDDGVVGARGVARMSFVTMRLTLSVKDVVLDGWNLSEKVGSPWRRA
jgi:hypothetical protein